MWRALSVARGDIVVYMDSDTRGFEGHFVCGLLGPLLVEDDVEFVKGSFRRPFAGESAETPAGGGRVTELMARPLFSAFYPDLAAFAQPLAGEVAARRACSSAIPFACGYAIETSMLLHARDLVGIEAMAQVDLDERRNHHQSLEQLGPMSYAVLRVILERLRERGSPARRRGARRSRPPTAAWCRWSWSSARPSPPCARPRSEPALRLHRPRRDDARPGRVAVPRRRGRLHAAGRPGAGGLPPGRGGGGPEVGPPPRPGDPRTRG